MVDGTVKSDGEDVENEARKRECLVPKPKGLFGQIMGFPEAKDRDGAVVVVKSLEEVRAARRNEKDERGS